MQKVTRSRLSSEMKNESEGSFRSLNFTIRRIPFGSLLRLGPKECPSGITCVT